MRVLTKQSSLVIGITGASGSGKSYISGLLYQNLNSAIMLSQDFYYKDRSDLPFEKREKINYDHPDAIEFKLLMTHLKDLRAGKSINHPLYDFTTHRRKTETRTTGPAHTIIVEGILILAVPDLKKLFDLTIYVEAPMDICFIHRLLRDTKERGRTLDSIVEQYVSTVRPMFFKYVEPSRERADLVVDEQDNIETILKRISKKFENN